MKKAIIHNDYDGIISYLLYKKSNPKVELEGYYMGCQKLVTKNPYNFDKMEYIGIDIEFEEFYNIGHHLQYQSLTNAKITANPNIIMGLDGPKDIREKCPFSTALLLILRNPILEKWFVKALKEKDYPSIALVLYADNFYPYIFDRYKSNVLRWFKTFKKEYLFNLINSFSQDQNEFKKINEELDKIQENLSDYLQEGTQGKYRQKIKTVHLKDVLNVLSDNIKVNVTDDIKGGFAHELKFKYFERKITPELLEFLKEEFKDGNLLSHGITNTETINFTLK